MMKTFNIFNFPTELIVTEEPCWQCDRGED